MQYSPKLKKVMEDIKSLLKKNDIAAIVVLHTPGFSEYLHHLQPSYSAAEILPEGNIFYKTATKHYASIEVRNKVITDTVNMMHHLSTHTGSIGLHLMRSAKVLDKFCNSEHIVGDQTSHNQQNN